MTPDNTLHKVKSAPITPEQKARLLAKFVFLPREKAKRRPRFCVDGRKGKRFAKEVELPQEPYGQTLGGDLNVSTARWILAGGQGDYLANETETMGLLVEAGYEQPGLHDGGHADAVKETSDCGFADNNALIIRTLGERAEEIWGLIEGSLVSHPEIKLNKVRFFEIIEDFVKKVNLSLIPSGKKIVDHGAVLPNVALQHLEDNHKEIAAVVNLVPETTLDVDDNQGETQAFNLDVWLLLEQARALGMNEEDVLLLSLGLYVATEMILVEAKRQIRIPIIVRA